MISVEDLSFKIKNDSDAIIEYITNSVVHLNNELIKKDEIIKEKEQEIDKYKIIIEQLKIEQDRSLRSIKDLAFDLKGLRQKFEMLKKNSTSNQLAIIYTPMDVFQYSEEIINEYINKVDLQYFAMDETLSFIDMLIQKRYWVALNVMIKKTIDTKLVNFSKSQFEQFIRLVEKCMYLGSEINQSSGKVLYYFIKKVNSLRWTELLQEFIENHKENIETNLFSFEDKQQRDRLVLEILKTYFLLNKLVFVRKFVENIINGDLITEPQSLTDKDIIEMLFISTCLDNDIFIFDYILKQTEGIDSIDWPEKECYITYYDVLEKRENISSYLGKFKVYKSTCKNINFDIKEKVINKMIVKLENTSEKKHQKLSQPVEKLKQFNEKKASLDTIESVFHIKNKDMNCPYDKQQLIYKYCNLEYFDYKKKRIKEGSLEVKLLYCQKCRSYYVNQLMLDEIRQQVPLNKIDYKPVNIANSFKRDIAVKKIENTNINNSNVIKYENNRSNVESKLNDNNLNNQSDLGKLGYTTALSREHRWNILINKAVPNLGQDWVKWFIKLQINLKKANTKKDYSRAIREWEYDLTRLNQRYR